MGYQSIHVTSQRTGNNETKAYPTSFFFSPQLFENAIAYTLKGIGMTLGLGANLDAVTSQYVDVRQQRKLDVLQIYHKRIIPEQSEIPPKSKQKSSKMVR